MRYLLYRGGLSLRAMRGLAEVWRAVGGAGAALLVRFFVHVEGEFGRAGGKLVDGEPGAWITRSVERSFADVDAVALPADDERAVAGESQRGLVEHGCAERESRDAGNGGVEADRVPNVDAGSGSEVVVAGNAVGCGLE